MATEDDKYKINSTDEYYDTQRQNSYRQLLNSEIQASVAKQNALKYTQNQLNQSGYANQGVAQSTNLGIQNSYRNALANAQSTYNTNIASINKEEYDTNQANIANNGSIASGYLEGTITTDDNGNVTGWDKEAYKNYLANYGVTFNGDKADFSNSKFTDADRIDMQNAYQTALNNYGDNSNGGSAVANSTYGVGYDTDGFYIGSNGFGKNVIFDKTFDGKNSMKVSGIAKGQNQKHDDDIDVDFKGKNYDLDIEWEGIGTKDSNQKITEATFNSSVSAIARKYPNPQNDQFVVYKNMVFFYDKDRARWGYVQKNVGGRKLYTDLTTYLNGGTPKRWDR